jgi:hypothetical protein
VELLYVFEPGMLFLGPMFVFILPLSLEFSLPFVFV